MREGSTTKKTRTNRNFDWSAFDAKGDEGRHQAALADPDAQPITEDNFAKMRPVPRARVIRRALGLTQEEFAVRFQIPIGTLRDWEQNRKPPDQTAQAYLRVIAREPDVVQKALCADANRTEAR